MNFRKLLASKVLGVFALSTFVVPSAANAQTQTFSDVPKSDVNFDAVEYLYDEGVVVGYSDGTYGFDRPINRAEFLKIAMEVSGEAVTGGNCYPDVADQWFAPYVCTATKLGLVEGYSDGMFRPEQNINFAEASKIISNALELDTEFPDAQVWYKHFVYALQDRSAIPTSVTAFDQTIERGEMADIIYRLDRSGIDRLSTTFDDIAAGRVVENYEVGLQEFRSCVALKAHVESNLGNRYYDIEPATGIPVDVMEESDDGSTASEAPSANTAGAAEGAGVQDFSKTNVQVEGVDEADIVKTDGKNIYLVKGNEVRVVDATPASNMAELDAVTFEDEDFWPIDMYVDGNRLVVIGDTYGDYSIMETLDSAALTFPREYFSSFTKVYIFEIGDTGKMDLLRELAFEGSHVSSRKVDDTVYLVANKYQSYYYYDPIIASAEELVPLVGDSSKNEFAPAEDCNDVAYIPGSTSRDYMTVAGIPVDDPDAEVDTEVVMGSYGTVYASRDNLYVAENRYNWGFNGFNDEETVVHRFALDEADVEYEGQGIVPGTILNQFSMDEHDGHFRIATTLGFNGVNNVYVLNEDTMNLVGELEGLAPGESIFSVRFMGDRAYMVTFKKVDPLFVIDLEDPENPEVLGKLKIPGYSDYLHPFDETHLIGFGKDAVDAGAEQDFAWYQGMKIAMFDVTDVENPVQLHEEMIGDRGTESELLWNHKALMYDAEEGVMAFPVTLAEIPEDVKADPETPDNTYGDYVFQGAYVYDVSVEDGFDLRGKISHYDESEVEDYSGYYWYGPKDIKRILYIGDVLYTVSMGAVKANQYNSSLNDLDQVELEGGEDDYYPIYEF